MRLISFLGFLFTVLLSSCSSPISGEVRKEADENFNFARVLENPTAYHGTVVIWGGLILKMVSNSGGSSLFLMETPLDLMGKPKGKEFSEGCFIAQTQELLDPKIYSEGLRVRITGEIIGEKLGKFRETPYVYPVVKAREIRLWKEEPAIKWDWGKTPFYVPDEFSPDKEHGGPMP